MTAIAQAALRPRKQPVQARSETTVLAIYEASIQVLLSVGYRKLTTTRVAERAGVSVGTLYQYFPNRQALIRAVLERYLMEMSASIEADCHTLRGRSLDEIGAGMVDAMIAAKWRRLDVSRAMHEPLVEVGGAELVRASAARGASLVADLLRSSPRSDVSTLNPSLAFSSWPAPRCCRPRSSSTPPTSRRSARTCTPWFAATCARCARADREICGRRRIHAVCGAASQRLE